MISRNFPYSQPPPAASLQFPNTNLFYCRVNDLSSLSRKDRLDGGSLLDYQADILREGARRDLHYDVCHLLDDTFASRGLLIHGIKLGLPKQEASARLDFRRAEVGLPLLLQRLSPFAKNIDVDEHSVRNVTNDDPNVRNDRALR